MHNSLSLVSQTFATGLLSINSANLMHFMQISEFKEGQSLHRKCHHRLLKTASFGLTEGLDFVFNLCRTVYVQMY